MEMKERVVPLVTSDCKLYPHLQYWYIETRMKMKQARIAAIVLVVIVLELKPTSWKRFTGKVYHGHLGYLNTSSSLISGPDHMLDSTSHTIQQRLYDVYSRGACRPLLDSGPQYTAEGGPCLDHFFRTKAQSGHLRLFQSVHGTVCP